MPTPSRNIRVDDELWQAAQAAAARRGLTVSAYVVGKLRELVEADRVQQAWTAGLIADTVTPATPTKERTP